LLYVASLKVATKGRELKMIIGEWVARAKEKS
jgi:hypothetical protein